MNRLRRFLVRMGVFLAIVLIVVATLHRGLLHAFTNNVGLNSVTLALLLTGIILNFRQVTLLEQDSRWLDHVRSGRTDDLLSTASPRLLAPLANMIGDRQARLSLSPAALRSLLDAVGSRLDESREIARYFTGLMIFLGLLGTFWGLSQTVGSLGDVIRNLTISGDDIQSALAGLKQGLDAPLAGMGTAFSTSLIGLSGSLILGFLDLQAGQAQNAFFNDLEEWLSGQTRMSAPVVGGGESGDQSVPAYIEALLEQTADSLDNLQRVLTRGEEGRIHANGTMRQLTDRLGTLADQMKTEQALMLKLAEHQLEMRPILQRIAEQAPGSAAPMTATVGLDDATRNHIRNLDMAVNRLVEETTHGREDLVREMRSEFRFLARTLAALADEDSSSPTSRS